MGKKDTSGGATGNTYDLQTAILNNTHVLIACLDREFNFIVVNENYARADGNEPSYYVGKNHFTLFPDKDNEAIFRRVVKTGEPYFAWAKPFEYAGNPERGTTHWDWSLNPVRDKNGKVSMLVFTLLNVTARIEAEEALRKSEERYRILYETMRDPFVQTSMDGRILFCNDAYCEMLGYSSEEILKLTYQELTPERWYEFESALVANQIITRGYSDVYEKEYRRKDGTEFPVELRTILARDSENHPASMWAIVRDISERRRVEEDLAEAHHKIQSIIDNTPSIVYAFDLEERFILVNEALAKLFKTTPEAMVGRRRHEFMPEEDANWHEANDRQVIESGRVMLFEEYSNLKDLSITWLTTKFPLYDLKGHVYAIAGISTDISERKRNEAELKAYNEKLEESVRLRTEELKKQQEHLQEMNQNLLRSNRELENFAYVASHDLQEPLRMVTSFTQLLSQKYNDKLDDDAREYIKYAVDGAKRMYELINGLLDYSRISRREVSFSKVDTNEIIEAVKANLSIVIRDRNCLVESDNLPEIFADRNQMIRLFQNLVSNGIKFSVNEPHIRISAKKEDSKYLFSVSDDGIGIESNYHEKIFEIFKRLNPRDQFEGTGIGLAICKRIVENHNGRIWVNSKPAGGSIFYFTLPV